MAHFAPDRRIASTENIAVIISLTLIVWLQHIDPNGGQDWGQPSNLRNVGLKSLAILSCCGKTERFDVFRKLCVVRTNDKKWLLCSGTWNRLLLNLRSHCARLRSIAGRGPPGRRQRQRDTSAPA
jgi:hypothetical protein